MKRIMVSNLCIILILLSIGCSNTTIDNNIDNEKEITILMTEIDITEMNYYYSILKNYSQRFKETEGVNVVFDRVSASNIDDYDKKTNAKLYLEDGPTLIFIPLYGTYMNYIDQGSALNIEGKITNLDKIYDGITDEKYYFIPIGISNTAIALNRKVLDILGIEGPQLNCNKEEYFEIKARWLKQNPECFTITKFWELVETSIDDLDIIDESNKNINLNNDRVIQYLNKTRSEIFSGKYILNEDYVYENYYNMIFESQSKEHKDAIDLGKYTSNDSLRDIYFVNDGLKSIGMDSVMRVSDNAILPDFLHEKIYTWGFIVNRNGKNTELGMKFIDGLLSDEVQLEMFSSKGDMYPVNKEIEDAIRQIEKERGINEKAIALRKYILEQVKSGNYISDSGSKIVQEIESMLYKDFTRFIFADEPYTEEDLSQELQKLENEYTMWLRE